MPYATCNCAFMGFSRSLSAVFWLDLSSRVNDHNDYYIVRRQLMPFRIGSDVTSGTSGPVARPRNGVRPRAVEGLPTTARGHTFR